MRDKKKKKHPFFTLQVGDSSVEKEKKKKAEGSEDIQRTAAAHYPCFFPCQGDAAFIFIFFFIFASFGVLPTLSCTKTDKQNENNQVNQKRKRERGKKKKQK